MASGRLLKRSEWLRVWNEREITIVPQSASGAPARLQWYGGSRPGWLVLDDECDASVSDGTLVLRNAERVVQFRSAGNVPVEDWLRVIEAARRVTPPVRTPLAHAASSSTNLAAGLEEQVSPSQEMVARRDAEAAVAASTVAAAAAEAAESKAARLAAQAREVMGAANVAIARTEAAEARSDEAVAKAATLSAQVRDALSTAQHAIGRAEAAEARAEAADAKSSSLAAQAREAIATASQAIAQMEAAEARAEAAEAKVVSLAAQAREAVAAANHAVALTEAAEARSAAAEAKTASLAEKNRRLWLAQGSAGGHVGEGPTAAEAEAEAKAASLAAQVREAIATASEALERTGAAEARAEAAEERAATLTAQARDVLAAANRAMKRTAAAEAKAAAAEAKAAAAEAELSAARARAQSLTEQLEGTGHAAHTVNGKDGPLHTHAHATPQPTARAGSMIVLSPATSKRAVGSVSDAAKVDAPLAAGGAVTQADECNTPSAIECHRRGLLANAAGEHEAACRWFLQAADQRPHPESLISAANMKVKLGLGEEALALYQQARAFDNLTDAQRELLREKTADVQGALQRTQDETRQRDHDAVVAAGALLGEATQTDGAMRRPSKAAPEKGAFDLGALTKQVLSPFQQAPAQKDAFDLGALTKQVSGSVVTLSAQFSESVVDAVLSPREVDGRGASRV